MRIKSISCIFVVLLSFLHASEQEFTDVHTRIVEVYEAHILDENPDFTTIISDEFQITISSELARTLKPGFTVFGRTISQGDDGSELIDWHALLHDENAMQVPICLSVPVYRELVLGGGNLKPFLGRPFFFTVTVAAISKRKSGLKLNFDEFMIQTENTKIGWGDLVVDPAKFGTLQQGSQLSLAGSIEGINVRGPTITDSTGIKVRRPVFDLRIDHMNALSVLGPKRWDIPPRQFSTDLVNPDSHEKLKKHIGAEVIWQLRFDSFEVKGGKVFLLPNQARDPNDKTRRRHYYWSIDASSVLTVRQAKKLKIGRHDIDFHGKLIDVKDRGNNAGSEAVFETLKIVLTDR